MRPRREYASRSPDSSQWRDRVVYNPDRKSPIIIVTGVSWWLIKLPPNKNVSHALLLQSSPSTLFATFYFGGMADGDGVSTGSVLAPNVVVRAGPFQPCVTLSVAIDHGIILVHGFLAPDPLIPKPF